MKSSITLNLGIENNHPFYEKYKAQVERHNQMVDETRFPNSGFDLFIPENVETKQFQTSFVDLGVKATMVTNGQCVAYQLYPRSSMSKYPLMLANHVGIIDSGYRGNLIGAFRSFVDGFVIEKDVRLLQICHPTLLPFYVKLVHPNMLEETERGAGGFGSTGI